MRVTEQAGSWKLGTRMVHRMGYGAMQLAGPGVFGPPRNRDAAIAVLQAAVTAGVNHIDTSDFYGPHVVNELIRDALSPYPADLALVSKVGARRDDAGNWLPDQSPEALKRQVRENLDRLKIDRLAAVNYRAMGDPEGHGPAEGTIAAQVEAMAELQAEGLIEAIGISTVTPAQIAEARSICDIACVQNQYNLAHRQDDAMIDDLNAAGIAYVPYFPLGGFSPLQSDTLSQVASSLDATPMQVALAWLLQRSPNILLIPGTSSVAHLQENLAAATLQLPEEARIRLDAIGLPANT
ncbi:MAG: oxidoreductase [Sphingomonas sp.]|nr:oxidoreductase [Sphingomonas sp.]